MDETAVEKKRYMIYGNTRMIEVIYVRVMGKGAD
jgi:hypothetical protein